MNISDNKILLVSVYFRKDLRPFFIPRPDFAVVPVSLVVVDVDGILKYAKVINPLVEMDTNRWYKLRERYASAKILRVANDKDISYLAKLEERERSANETCKKSIEKLNLPMHLIETVWDEVEKKYVFYFTADARVDFRELVKDLISIFNTKIQLWQVGARDAMRFFGGLGPCGFPLCCTNFLKDIESVELSAAREQNLSLNAQKITGACGKLMCCLRYELNAFREEEIEENY